MEDIHCTKHWALRYWENKVWLKTVGVSPLHGTSLECPRSYNSEYACWSCSVLGHPSNRLCGIFCNHYEQSRIQPKDGWRAKFLNFTSVWWCCQLFHFIALLTFTSSKQFIYWPCTHYRETNSQKLLFISISCIYIIFCVHIDNYLYKLMLCWKFHIIPMRNSQDMDHWNIYLHFLGHVRLGDSANECACAKIKNRNIRNFGFYIELFHFLKHFRRSLLFLLQFFHNVTKK